MLNSRCSETANDITRLCKACFKEQVLLQCDNFWGKDLSKNCIISLKIVIRNTQEGKLKVYVYKKGETN